LRRQGCRAHESRCCCCCCCCCCRFGCCQEATLEKEIGYGAQLEELIDEASDEIYLISLYAKDKCWERSLDESWRADIEADIQQGFAKEDAENAKTA
jgi:hypothetical protein